MRFRKSIKLAPGFRLNLSGSGVSASVGPRGASMTFGKRGTHLNTGIPGTGLYSRQRIDGGRSSSASTSSPSKVRVSAVVAVTDEGEVEFRDADGDPLQAYLVDQAKRQNGPAIRDMIATACEKLNAASRAAAEIHLATPDPSERPSYQMARFEAPEPVRPVPVPHGFLGWLLKSVAARIDEENASATRVYEQQCASWRAEKDFFEREQRRRKQLVEEDLLHDTGAMAAYLEELLQSIDWPRETNVDFEIRDDGATVLLDVDLPEIEDMPRRTASLPARGYKVTMKDISAAQLQKHYMAHVHGLGFRLIGETFAALPTAKRVVLSAYSQRASKATGAVTDEYLYSVRVPRENWATIDFGNLDAVDVVEALGRFDLRRSLSKSGAFAPIEPFAD